MAIVYFISLAPVSYLSVRDIQCMEQYQPGIGLAYVPLCRQLSGAPMANVTWQKPIEAVLCQWFSKNYESRKINSLVNVISRLM